MKKMIAWMCGSAAVLGLLAGCTSVDSTQKFNQVLLVPPAEGKAVCHTSVEIPCYTFWGIPIFGGSAAGDGKVSLFQNNADVESVMHLLTQDVRGKGATRIVNVNTSMVEGPALLFFGKRVMQASGTGVSVRSERVRQVGQDYDQMPLY